VFFDRIDVYFVPSPVVVLFIGHIGVLVISGKTMC
jgi:hypothetical protein